MTHDASTDFHSPAVRRLREDLALALRAAAHHGLGEGVCNHFSVMLPGEPARYLINPRGLHWSEVGADDVVMIDV
ncbi:class II aldolase/adducin family protein, partial [Pseudacidovorax intermedius]